MNIVSWDMILSSLLVADRCVKIGASAWWEDTVYGYIKSRVDKLKGSKYDRLDELLPVDSNEEFVM